VKSWNRTKWTFAITFHRVQQADAGSRHWELSWYWPRPASLDPGDIYCSAPTTSLFDLLQHPRLHYRLIYQTQYVWPSCSSSPRLHGPKLQIGDDPRPYRLPWVHWRQMGHSLQPSWRYVLYDLPTPSSNVFFTRISESNSVKLRQTDWHFHDLRLHTSVYDRTRRLR